MEKIAIIGGGLVGGVIAGYLGQKGYNISLFERRSDIRTADIAAGKSINLALSDRGWKALREIGLEEEVEKMVIPMHGRMIHHLNGELEFQAYGKEGQAINSISRGGLNQTLLQNADKLENVSMNFNCKCEDIDLKSNTVSFINTDTGKKFTEQFDRILGTDGTFSAVRSRLQKTDRFNYSQSYLEHSYKELAIYPNEDGSHKMDKNSLHIWPRGQYMLIALPNLDGSFTLTLFLAHRGTVSFEALNSDDKIIRFFEEQFPDALEIMPDLLRDYHANPTASLAMIHCFPWNYKDQIALMGDAAHATVPFYGQGMNSGFEDCFEFNRIFEKNNRDWSLTLEEFTKERKPNGDAVIELSLRNYIVMRDLTTDPQFILQKKIEKWFSVQHPDLWMPLYEQVTFSDIPYIDALNRGDLQDEIMADILKIPGIESNYKSKEIETKILTSLESRGISAL